MEADSSEPMEQLGTSSVPDDQMRESHPGHTYNVAASRQGDELILQILDVQKLDESGQADMTQIAELRLKPENLPVVLDVIRLYETFLYRYPQFRERLVRLESLVQLPDIFPLDDLPHA